MSAVDVLAESKPETDPDREGTRVMLACAASALPSLATEELVTVALGLFPQLQRLDRETIEDVARRMGI